VPQRPLSQLLARVKLLRSNRGLPGTVSESASTVRHFRGAGVKRRSEGRDQNAMRSAWSVEADDQSRILGPRQTPSYALYIELAPSGEIAQSPSGDQVLGETACHALTPNRYKTGAKQTSMVCEANVAFFENANDQVPQLSLRPQTGS